MASCPVCGRPLLYPQERVTRRVLGRPRAVHRACASNPAAERALALVVAYANPLRDGMVLSTTEADAVRRASELLRGKS